MTFPSGTSLYHQGCENQRSRDLPRPQRETEQCRGLSLSPTSQPRMARCGCWASLGPLFPWWDLPYWVTRSALMENMEGSKRREGLEGLRKDWRPQDTDYSPTLGPSSGRRALQSHPTHDPGLLPADTLLCLTT